SAAQAAGDAIDTRVTFTVADDDIARGPEETVRGGSPSPSVPNFSPTNNNRLFFDDYERRDTGFENLTHFVLYGRQPGFFEGWDTEAALVMRAMILDGQAVTLKDDGTYIRIARKLAASEIDVTA